MRKSMEARQLNAERRAIERERNAARSYARNTKRAGFTVSARAFTVTVKAGI